MPSFGGASFGDYGQGRRFNLPFTMAPPTVSMTNATTRQDLFLADKEIVLTVWTRR